MALFNISVSDQKRGETITPGWYPFEILDVSESKSGKEAKNPGSLNTVIKCKGLDKEAKDHIVYVQFNETAPGFVVPFAKALGWKLDGKQEEKVMLDNKTIKGKKFLGLIGHNIYKGVTKNQFEDFRPLA